jgi:hypothetical protein
MLNGRHTYQILTQLEFSRELFKKFSNIVFHENPSIGLIYAEGLTHMNDPKGRRLQIFLKSLIFYR